MTKPIPAIATHVEDVPPEEMGPRAAEAMKQMAPPAPPPPSAEPPPA